MSDATYTTVGIVEESTYGTTPASALQLINVSSVDLNRDLNVSRPNILTGDRRRHANQILQKSGALNLPAPLQYENFLLLHEGVMMNDRGAAVTVTASTISFDSATETIADSGSGLGSFAVGDWVYVSGSANSGNNGWKGPVLTAAAGALTFPNGQVVTTEVAGSSITIKTRRLLDGSASTIKSYSAEYQITDLTTEFRSGTGYRVVSWECKWSQGSWAEERVSLMGQVPGMANATIGTGAATAAATAPFMNAVDDFQTILFGSDSTSSTFSAIATDLTLTISNTLNPVYGLGNVGPSNYSVGPQDISLALTLYYDDNARTIMDLAEAHTTIWIGFDVVDSAGNRMAFSLPSMKPDDGDIQIGEAGNQITLPLQFSGHDPARDSGSLSTSIPYQSAFFYVPVA